VLQPFLVAWIGGQLSSRQQQQEQQEGAPQRSKAEDAAAVLLQPSAADTAAIVFKLMNAGLFDAQQYLHNLVAHALLLPVHGGSSASAAAAAAATRHRRLLRQLHPRLPWFNSQETCGQTAAAGKQQPQGTNPQQKPKRQQQQQERPLKQQRRNRKGHTSDGEGTLALAAEAITAAVAAAAGGGGSVQSSGQGQQSKKAKAGGKSAGGTAGPHSALTAKASKISSSSSTGGSGGIMGLLALCWSSAAAASTVLKFNFTNSSSSRSRNKWSPGRKLYAATRRSMLAAASAADDTSVAAAAAAAVAASAAGGAKLDASGMPVPQPGFEPYPVPKRRKLGPGAAAAAAAAAGAAATGQQISAGNASVADDAVLEGSKGLGLQVLQLLLDCALGLDSSSTAGTGKGFGACAPAHNPAAAAAAGCVVPDTDIKAIDGSCWDAFAADARGIGSFQQEQGQRGSVQGLDGDGPAAAAAAAGPEARFDQQLAAVSQLKPWEKAVLQDHVVAAAAAALGLAKHTKPSSSSSSSKQQSPGAIQPSSSASSGAQAWLSGPCAVLWLQRVVAVLAAADGATTAAVLLLQLLDRAVSLTCQRAGSSRGKAAGPQQQQQQAAASIPLPSVFALLEGVQDVLAAAGLLPLLLEASLSWVLPAGTSTAAAPAATQPAKAAGGPSVLTQPSDDARQQLGYVISAAGRLLAGRSTTPCVKNWWEGFLARTVQAAGGTAAAAGGASGTAAAAAAGAAGQHWAVTQLLAAVEHYCGAAVASAAAGGNAAAAAAAQGKGTGSVPDSAAAAAGDGLLKSGVVRPGGVLGVKGTAAAAAVLSSAAARAAAHLGTAAAASAVEVPAGEADDSMQAVKDSWDQVLQDCISLGAGPKACTANHSSGTGLHPQQQQQQQQPQGLADVQQLMQHCRRVTVRVLQVLAAKSAAAAPPAQKAAAAAAEGGPDSIQGLADVVAAVLSQLANTLSAAAAAGSASGSQAAARINSADLQQQQQQLLPSVSGALTAEALCSSCFVTVLSQLQLLLVNDRAAVEAAQQIVNISCTDAGTAAAAAAGGGGGGHPKGSSSSSAGLRGSFGTDVSWGIAKAIVLATKQCLQLQQEHRQQQQLVMNAVLAAAAAGLVLLPDLAQELLAAELQGQTGHLPLTAVAASTTQHKGPAVGNVRPSVHAAGVGAAAAAAAAGGGGGGGTLQAGTTALVLKSILGDAAVQTSSNIPSSSSSSVGVLGCDAGMSSTLCRLQQMLPAEQVCSLLQLPLLAAVLTGMQPGGSGPAPAAAAVGGIKAGTAAVADRHGGTGGGVASGASPGPHKQQQQQQALPAALSAALSAVISHPPVRSCLLSDVQLLYSKLAAGRPAAVAQMLAGVGRQQLRVLPQRLVVQSVMTGILCLSTSEGQGSVGVGGHGQLNPGPRSAGAAGTGGGGSSSGRVPGYSVDVQTLTPDVCAAAAEALGEGSDPVHIPYLLSHVEVFASLANTLDHDVAWLMLRVLLAEELWLQFLESRASAAAAGGGVGEGGQVSRAGSNWGKALGAAGGGAGGKSTWVQVRFWL
jgi:hypothetical protein